MNGSPATRAGARPPAEVVAAAVLAFVQAAAVMVASVFVAFLVVVVALAAQMDVPSGLPFAELIALATVQLASIAALVIGGVRVLRRRDRTSRRVLAGALVVQLPLAAYWTVRVSPFFAGEEPGVLAMPPFGVVVLTVAPVVGLGLLSTPSSRAWFAGGPDGGSTPHR